MNATRVSANLCLARDAYAHLGACLMQYLPTDDQIIIAHVQAAQLRLSELIADLTLARDAA